MRAFEDDGLHILEEQQEIPNANISQDRSYPIFIFKPYYSHTFTKNVTTKSLPSKTNVQNQEGPSASP